MAGNMPTSKVCTINTNNLVEAQPDNVHARLLFVGEDSLQMSILKNLVSEEFSLPAACISQTAFSETESTCQSDTLLVLDCHTLPIEQITAILEQVEGRNPGVVLLNLDKGSVYETLAGWPHVTGILRPDLSPELAIRGFSHVLRGGLWLPRSVMEKLLLDHRHKQPEKPVTTEPDVRLTRRETQILMKLAEGASNTQIADALFLSEHTVKTHLYNIYRKVNVKNRTQASNWLKRQSIN